MNDEQTSRPAPDRPAGDRLDPADLRIERSIMKIERKAAIIVQGNEVLTKSGFVPIVQITPRNQIRMYESVSKAKSASLQCGGTPIEVIETIEIPVGTIWN